MAVFAFRIVPGALFLVYATVLAYRIGVWALRGKGERFSGRRDCATVALFALGHVPVALYFATPWMDRFYVHVHPALRVWGVPLLFVGEAVWFGAIWALGRCWSPLLELRPDHALVREGVYRHARHPMYAGFFLMGFGIALVSANAAAAAAFLGPLALLYATRVNDEERMLRQRFGDVYHVYAERTERLVPRVATRLLRKRRVRAALLLPASLGLVACGAVVLDGLRDELGKADVAVVLGNRVYPNGKPSPSLQARLDATLRLYRAGWFPEILVSGGLGRDGFDEAVVMRAYLVDRGVPAERVHVDSQGVDTRATARNAAAFMRGRGMDSAMVVTQYYHVPRSRLALRMAAVPTVYSAHARHFAWKDIYAVPREVLGWVWYRLGGNGVAMPWVRPPAAEKQRTAVDTLS